jgi:hypothetical protein
VIEELAEVGESERTITVTIGDSYAVAGADLAERSPSNRTL